jgi:hypothetical protein
VKTHVFPLERCFRRFTAWVRETAQRRSRRRWRTALLGDSCFVQAPAKESAHGNCIESVTHCCNLLPFLAQRNPSRWPVSEASGGGETFPCRCGCHPVVDPGKSLRVLCGREPQVAHSRPSRI